MSQTASAVAFPFRRAGSTLAAISLAATTPINEPIAH
jgi:hypothetical protein